MKFKFSIIAMIGILCIALFFNSSIEALTQDITTSPDIVVRNFYTEQVMFNTLMSTTELIRNNMGITKLCLTYINNSHQFSQLALDLSAAWGHADMSGQVTDMSGQVTDMSGQVTALTYVAFLKHNPAVGLKQVINIASIIYPHPELCMLCNAYPQAATAQLITELTTAWNSMNPQITKSASAPVPPPVPPTYSPTDLPKVPPTDFPKVPPTYPPTDFPKVPPDFPKVPPTYSPKVPPDFPKVPNSYFPR